MSIEKQPEKKYSYRTGRLARAGAFVTGISGGILLVGGAINTAHVSLEGNAAPQLQERGDKIVAQAPTAEELEHMNDPEQLRDAANTYREASEAYSDGLYNSRLDLYIIGGSVALGLGTVGLIDIRNRSKPQ